MAKNSKDILRDIEERYNENKEQRAVIAMLEYGFDERRAG